MKKIITVALILTMVFTMAACGGNNTDGEGEGGNPITVVSREDGSGTRGAFTELMGIMVDDVDNTTPTAEISQSTSVVVTTVAGNKNAIGYISLASLGITICPFSPTLDIPIYLFFIFPPNHTFHTYYTKIK